MINMATELSTKFIKMVNGIFPKRSFIESLSQKHCYLCDVSVYGKAPICHGCLNDLPFNHACCVRCALPLPKRVNLTASAHQDRVCGECFNNKPSYTECFSAFHYTFPINALIGGFKYSQKRHLGKLLSTLTAKTIKDRIESERLHKPDFLIPVPLHVDKLNTRGFNQSLDICKDLSHHLDVPVDSNCIQRTMNNPSQASLSKKERQQNLAKAFCIRRNLEGKVVTLVDDVITTGVTVELLSQLLLKAGAQEVYVWSLARTPLNQ